MKTLTVVIPTFNAQTTIYRLMESIVNQNWPKDDLTVVVSDDNSTDNTLNIIKEFEDRLDIEVYSVSEHKTHCPGNTRLDGLNHVTNSKWVTFIDHDDTFELEAFDKFRKAIEENPNAKAVSGNFRQYNFEKQEYVKTYIQENTWLHGKFYLVSYLHDTGIQFKEDLESNEDLYFNSYVLGTLIGKNMNYVYIDDFLYRWSDNPDSHSRSFFKGKYYYTDYYFIEYMQASIDPHLDMIRKYPLKVEFMLNQIMMNLLHSYFYYESCEWRLGLEDEICKRNLKQLCEYIIRIQNELNITWYQIVSYIYSLPDRYHHIKQNSFSATNYFVEMSSFKDIVVLANNSEGAITDAGDRP